MLDVCSKNSRAALDFCGELEGRSDGLIDKLRVQRRGWRYMKVTLTLRRAAQARRRKRKWNSGKRTGATRGRGSLSVPEIKISPRLFRPCSILIPRLFATSLLTLNCYLWSAVWSFLPIGASPVWTEVGSNSGRLLKILWCSFNEGPVLCLYYTKKYSCVTL